jgi:hypothetical protein
MIRDYLPCKVKEGGGQQCERQDPHGDDGHWWSRHTIEHERMGNGWACWGEGWKHAPAPPGGRIAELREQIAGLSAELAELEALEQIDVLGGTG